MLSILIPSYNQICLELVRNIYIQATNAELQFEIIVADDASMEAVKIENRLIADFPHCRFIELDKNIGPAKIRNYLADKAKYEYLLFLDSDVMPVNMDFISAYIQQVNPETVICGGFKYHFDKSLYQSTLRHKYGVKVEQRNVHDRNRKPYRNFIGMNFLIPKILIERIPFDDKLHFGYEDALFGKELEINKIRILHIYNPVYHEVQDNNEDYLIKTRKSINNLIGREERMKSHVRLLSTYDKVNKLGLKKILLHLFNKNENRILSNLKGKNPSLKLFAFYKLGYLCRLKL